MQTVLPEKMGMLEYGSGTQINGIHKRDPPGPIDSFAATANQIAYRLRFLTLSVPRTHI